MISVLIPARGGSKGLPRKNLQKVGPFTLIQHSIIHAEKIFGSDVKIFISTEDEEIKKQHKGLIIDRPAELASDEASTHSVICHAMQFIDTEYICLLQPTHVFRDCKLIREQLPDFYNSGKECGFTAQEFHGFLWSEDGSPLNRDIDYRPRRQDMPKQYLEDGGFYIFNRNVATKKDFIWENPYIFFGLNLLDIHTQNDLSYANKLWSFQWSN